MRYDPILCMLVDEPTKAQDESYIVRGRKYKVVKRDGDYVTVIGPDGKVTKMHIDFLMSEGKKARDVAPATQRYINTIVDESKANAEKFVRQAEQDDEVPENELKYVYKAYNEKFGYKFHDSASALDKAIKTADGATGDKLYADVKAIYSLFSNILLTYSNEQSVQKLANEGTKKCLELAAKVKGVRDKAIKTSDASTGHKVVVFVENYLRSIGKNNSTGKYDRIVQGVRSLLSQSLLDDEGLKKAAEHEADRLLKKYNL